MRMAVLHVNTATLASTSPTMRIASFVADTLQVPIIHSPKSAEQHLKTKFDVLFVKYGMLKFSAHREEALRIYEQAGKVINLENDYTFVPDKRFRPADETWSTVEGRTRLVNWNMLTRHPATDWQVRRPLRVPVHEGLVYYGAHRDDRGPSFERYFRNATYPLSISTYRGRVKFQQYSDSIKILGAFKDPDAAANWPATLYIEDEQSHSLYCSPATRFYECVMAGVVQLVDEAAVHTLQRAGMAICGDWVVSNQKDVKSCLKHWRDIQQSQRDGWYRDYYTLLRGEFAAAIEASKL